MTGMEMIEQRGLVYRPVIEIEKKIRSHSLESGQQGDLGGTAGWTNQRCGERVESGQYLRHA